MPISTDVLQRVYYMQFAIQGSISFLTLDSIFQIGDQTEYFSVSH